MSSIFLFQLLQPVAATGPEMEPAKLVRHLAHEFCCANAQTCSSRLEIDVMKMMARA
jgi:hypothetical protein